ncbi:MAG: SUMF1/EgtB/PvdO family nonheme iron enzyme [Thermoguttaceae bacterium]|jgi:formylglycine-generating enzyme required for sulfatase activity
MCHKLNRMILAAVMLILAASFAQGQTHAPWPTDWNNWSDPALWATVDDESNMPDTRYNGISVGAVDYTYQIGKFEVTAGQYCNFLNSVAQTDTYGLYNDNMDVDYNFTGCNIKRTGSSGNYIYNVASDRANRPVNFVSFWDACRFVNWLHNGQPTGPQNLFTTEDGAYTLNGYNGQDGKMIARNPGAKYCIPNADEWYKAAYYEGGNTDAGYWDYATQTNLPPSNIVTYPDPGNNANFSYAIDSPYYRTPVGEFENSESAYGTFDQSGNILEWIDTIVSQGPDWASREARGGAFNYNVDGLEASERHWGYPTIEYVYSGFRIASVPESVPEPGCITLLFACIACLLSYAWRRRNQLDEKNVQGGHPSSLGSESREFETRTLISRPV